MTDQQQKTDNINVKDFLIGSMIGGALGTMASLLFAPKSGKEMRRDLADQSVVLRNKSSELARNVSDQTNRLTDKAKEFSDRFKSEECGEENQDSIEIAVTKEAEEADLAKDLDTGLNDEDNKNNF